MYGRGLGPREFWRGKKNMFLIIIVILNLDSDFCSGLIVIILKKKKNNDNNNKV